MNEIQRQATMMALRQHELNVIANGANWIALKRPWWRAMWVECAELMDHFGTWEWWKDTAPDMPQVRLEMVDIFHFGLSAMIEEHSSMDAAVTGLLTSIDVGDRTDAPLRERFIMHVEAMSAWALNTHSFSAFHFFSAWAALGSDFKELYLLYMAKNVLNTFRQQHGYKSGTYQKVWAGREDNWHLVNVVANTPIDLSEDEFFKAVREGLKSLYYRLVVYGGNGGVQQSPNY